MEKISNTNLNFERLRKDIEALSAIGRDPRGGISRPSFSKADLEAREWLKAKINDAGLMLRRDGAGNIFGRLDGEGKTIMAGSHIDTVINGGPYDGSIGVLSALECLRRIREEKIAVKRPLEVVSFTDEEGNLVGDFMGSRAFLGLLDRDLLEKEKTQFGSPLKEVLKQTDFSIDSIMAAHRDRPDVEAFLEIHIEQGTVLETENKTIGIVDRIAGKRHRLCSFLGKAGHSGTTPFELRHDAFLGLADFALKCTRYTAAEHYGSLVTIGKVFVSPGTFSIIPEKSDFSLDFRSTSNDTLETMNNHFLQLADDIASTRGLQFTSALVDRTDPVETAPRIVTILEKICTEKKYSYMKMASGAGHDAQIMASAASSGMIFIPCTDGISHAPDENIQWDHLEKGADLLFQALLQLSS